MAISAIIGLTACKSGETTYYEVTFNTDGGSLIESVEVEKGTTLNELPIAKKDGYEFLGWYSNAEKTEKFVLTTPINSDVTLYASFKIIEYVTITFNTDGEALEPKTLVKGSKLASNEVPIAVKDGCFFDGWYLDEEKTTGYDYNSYVFSSDVTLYASFMIITDSIEQASYFEQTETSLFSQPKTVSLKIVGEGALTAQNLSTYLTVTAEANAVIPEFNITNNDGYYSLSPKTAYTEGGSYHLTLTSPFSFEVVIEKSAFNEATTIKIARLNLNVFCENFTTVEYTSDAIEIKVADYYYISEDLLYLKSSYALAPQNEIKRGDIIKVYDADNSFEFYKTGNFSGYKNGAIDAVVVELLAPSLQEVYNTLNTFEQGEITEDNITEEISDAEIINALSESEGVHYITALATAAVADYAAENNIKVTSLYSNKLKIESLSADRVESKIKEKSYRITKRIDINNNSYATVDLEFTQLIAIGYGTSGYIDWFDDYDLDIYGRFSSATEFRVDVTLTRDGKTSNIREEISRIINNPDPDGLVADYQRNRKMDTDEVRLLSVKLYEARVPLKAIEFTFPVTLNFYMDVNAAFAADYDAFVAYQAGIRGTDETGLKSYKEQLFNEHNHKFYYNGQLSFKGGVEIAMEVSFTGLNKLGCVGLGVELGCYFDFYGIGSYEMKAYTYLDSHNNNVQGKYTSAQGAYFYEFGIYVDLHLYAESELFNLRAEQKLVRAKIPVFSKGTESVAVSFVTPQNDITLYGDDSFSIVSGDFLYVNVLNLKTGKITQKKADLADIVVSPNDNLINYKAYDKSTGTVTIKNLDEGRVELNIYVYYFGERMGFSGSVNINHKYSYWKQRPLISTIDVTYFDKYVSDEDAAKVLTVSYKIGDDVILTEDVKYGAYPEIASRMVVLGSDDATKRGLGEYAQLYPHIKSFFFPCDSAVTADVTYEITFLYKEYTKVRFSYLLKCPSEINSSTLWMTDDFTVGVGTVLEPEYYYIETDQLFSFNAENPNFNEYVIFDGWSADGEVVPKVGKGEFFECKAKYIYKTFDITVEVPALYDYLDETKMLIGPQVYTVKTTYGKFPEFDIQTYPNYYLQYTYDGMTGENYLYDTPQKVSGESTFKPVWKAENSGVVTFRDYNGTVILSRRDIASGADATDLLNDPAVKAYEEKENNQVFEKPFLKSRFVSWQSINLLDSVYGSVEIYPFVEYYYVYTLICFDGSGGQIPWSMQYTASVGFEVLKGEENTIGEDFIASFAPEYRIVNDRVENFNGWEIVKTVSPSGQDVWTYVAQYIESPYMLKVYSNGELYTFENSTVTCTPVSASFSNGQTEIIYNGTYAEIDELTSTLNSLESEIEKPTLEDGTEYTFYRWVISSYLNEWRARPQFKLADGIATAEYDIGNGSYDGQTGVLVYSISLGGGYSYDFTVEDLFEPDESVQLVWFNAETNKIVNTMCCYYDDTYYYTQGHWVYENGNAVPDGTEFSVEIGEKLSLKYVYTATKRQHLVTFTINRAERESFDDNDSWYYNINVEAGTAIDSTLIPVADKTAEELSLYEYTFSNWKSITEGFEDITAPILYDVEFVSEFSKSLREITLTYDAGEYGIFVSTNSRYRYETLAAGSVIYDYGEEPVFTSPSKYFNYAFDGWNYDMTALGFEFDYDTAVGAYYKKIRTAVKTDESVGITITNADGKAEDIGNTRLSGYEYNPDEKRLTVTGEDMTISGVASTDIQIDIMAKAVTLKNLTVQGYLGTFHSDNTVTVYIEGTVTINSDINVIGAYQDAIIFEGKGENAKLVINSEIAEGEYISSDSPVELIGGHLITFKKLSVEINIEAAAEFTVYAIAINNENSILTLIDSDISCTLSGGASGAVIAYYNTESLVKDALSSIQANGCDAALIRELF